jgi:hypothetical protein
MLLIGGLFRGLASPTLGERLRTRGLSWSYAQVLQVTNLSTGNRHK